MKKRNQQDALQLLEIFQKSVLQNKPPLIEMISEIRMMKFKIKPIQGDFSRVNFNDHELINILWSLGKMDEFFQSQFPTLKVGQRNTFFNYFDSLQRKFQDDLNKLNLREGHSTIKPSVLEMEIFKERSRGKKTN